MTKEIFNLFANNKPLPKGTRIATMKDGVLINGTHELSDDQLESVNQCPNKYSEHVPVWVLASSNLHDKLFLPNEPPFHTWIAVADKLPEGDEVICWDGDTVSTYFPVTGEPPNCGRERCQYLRVSHWMPLPLPPSSPTATGQTPL